MSHSESDPFPINQSVPVTPPPQDQPVVPTSSDHSGSDGSISNGTSSDDSISNGTSQDGSISNGTEQPIDSELDDKERVDHEPIITGSIREQIPGETVPRPPTVAEARARDKAQREREEQLRLAELHDEKKRQTKRGVATLAGLAGLSALILLTVHYYDNSHNETIAHCVNDNNEVVDERFCGGTEHTGLVPFFIYGGSHYHYYYGGHVNSQNSRISGGTLSRPGGSIKSPSGKSIQRGGFGSSNSHGFRSHGG